MLIRGFQYGGGSGGGGGASSDGPANAIQVSNGTGGFVGESAFSYDPATNTVGLASGVQTANNPAFNISQTWNNAAVTFTGLQFNATNTASGASSLLLDLQVGGISRAFVTRDGGFRGTYFGIAPLSASGSGFIFYGTGNRPKFRYAGVNVFEFGNNVFVINSTGSLAWASSGISGTDNATASDLVVTRDAANTLAQRNGTNAQTFRVYNTYTDASNYERGFARWNSNVYEIGTEAAGSGTNRDLWLRSATNKVKIGVGAIVSVAGQTSYFYPWDGNDAYVAQQSANLLLHGASSVSINSSAGSNIVVSSRKLAFSLSSAYVQAEITGWDHGANDNGSAAPLIIRPGDATTKAGPVNIIGANLNLRGGAAATQAAGAANGGHVYLDGGQGYGTGVHGNIIIGNTRGKLQLTPTTVANLGSASPAGQRTFVTDANSTTFHSIVAAGGANFVPVFSDGTNWRIG